MIENLSLSHFVQSWFLYSLIYNNVSAEKYLANVGKNYLPSILHPAVLLNDCNVLALKSLHESYGCGIILIIFIYLLILKQNTMERMH